jgi:hypothetical protein
MATYESSSPRHLGQAIAALIEDARHSYFERMDEVEGASQDFLDYDDCDACVARVALQAIDGYLLAAGIGTGR